MILRIDRLRQRHDHGLRVRRGEARRGVLGGEAVGLQERGLRQVQRHQPVQRPDHVLGRHRVARGEGRALAQVEGDALAVRRDLPALGEVRVDLGPVLGVERDEAVVDVGEDLHRLAAGDRRRVEGQHVGHREADDELVVRRLGEGGDRRGREQRGEGEGTDGKRHQDIPPAVVDRVQSTSLICMTYDVLARKRFRVSGQASRRRRAGWCRGCTSPPARPGRPRRRRCRRLAPAAGRDAVEDRAVAVGVGAQRLGVVGRDVARRDGVDVDAPAPPTRWRAAWSARRRRASRRCRRGRGCRPGRRAARRC